MILNTGSRTDIPAFFSDWFYKRIQEGYVCVRNPYNPKRVTRFKLDPEVVDILSFCTKNPKPMLDRMDLLKPFHQQWQVTITPYGKDIEPNVPNKHEVLASFQELSSIVGSKAVCWRYDPIFLSEKYSMEYHQRAFKTMAETLNGYTHSVVISFIDLYEKTKKNFPEVKEVSLEQQMELTSFIVQVAKENGMVVRTCLENPKLKECGADVSGCTTKEVLEEATGLDLVVPKGPFAREGCTCLLGNDIGVYNTCRHFCRYCYANYDQETVFMSQRLHDPNSPLLIGHIEKDDEVVDAKQFSYQNKQIGLF